MRSRVLALLLLARAVSLHALDVPPAPKRWATDRAGILSTTELSLLDSKLENFEQSSGAQFIVYIFPSTEGASIEEFTIRCARQWGVGQKKYENGLILFVFVQDRKARFEVGDGLEGTITDAFSSRVIREILAPPFQRGAYGEGLNAAADAIIQKIRTGEEPVPPLHPRGSAQPSSSSSEGGDISPFTIIIILFVVFFVILPMLSRGRRGRGGCGGCLPLFFFPGGGGGITFGGGGGGFGGGGFGGGGGFSGGGGGFSGGGSTGGW